MQTSVNSHRNCAKIGSRFANYFPRRTATSRSRADVQSQLSREVMRALVVCLGIVSHDTYRGLCPPSYFPYDVEPYIVPTAMAERRKQQGKGSLSRSTRPSLYGHRSISLRPGAVITTASLISAIQLQTFQARPGFLHRHSLRCTTVISFEDIC